ncbi:MAG TPA: RagB/SusD family nutrient uptake outer membrane protein [Gemmatimonadales bacterium]|nr:RagB/SusD family nutrient uptake outer membrane protein [Gemmatimonadales bacterium]
MTTARATALAALSLALGGCNSILDLKDLTAINEADVWKSPALAEAYVSHIYLDNLPGWSTGDATTSDESPGGTAYMYGQLTENSVGYWQDTVPYRQIRRINILLAEIDGGTLDTALVKKLKGEAYFFRAWRYWELVKRYGGVPLVLRPQALTDNLLVPRTRTSECVAQIISDLDSAVALLPAVSVGAGNDGHVHQGTALAVKGRVLLYYASPQFNRTDDMTRWQNAYDANHAARDYLAGHGFGLYPEFEKVWFVEMNREAVFVRRYQFPGSRVEQNGQEIGAVHRWAAATRPLDESQNATGANRPTLEMVNAFPMRDGRPIANNPAYDSLYFWKSRDPRFYATIAYNGAGWPLSGKTGRRQWTYVGGETNNPTPTGFYARKAVDPSQDALGAFNGQTQWIEIRYAEVLLNLAEAANAIGNTQEAYDQIIALRARAGIDPGTGLYGLDPGMTRQQMQDAIMLERRIEFAFEAKRFWDLRRNMLFESQLNGTRRHRVTIALKVPVADWLLVRDTVDLDSKYPDYFDTQVKLLDTQFDINWQPNYYFFAIPPSQRQTNGNLEQTMGWAGGTFDPLQ